MSEIEKKEVEETEEVDETTEETETDPEVTEEETEEKSKEPKTESPEAKLARLERQAKQLRKKLGVEEKAEPKKAKKSDDIDYAQEAYLIAQGIKEADERELVRERMEDTGKSLKEIIESKSFQRDVKELRDERAVKLATPSSSRRSSVSAKDTVDYWKAKIDAGQATLLDVSDIKLRRQIVNSRLAKEKDINHFTDNPFGTIDIGLPKR